MTRILITGSRNWRNKKKMQKIIFAVMKLEDTSDDVTIVHGGARGADELANQIAKEFGYNLEVYPADWEQYGKAAGAIRNQQMVDLGADICLAFPLADSKGTIHCMKAAKKAGIRVINGGDQSILPPVAK